MKFDSIIIGGGVAGLSCAIRCAEAGMKTAVIAAGQSALHFSSGSVDVLSRQPNGEAVDAPFAAFASLKPNARLIPIANWANCSAAKPSTGIRT